LREEQRLRVSENRVLRIFGPKREEDGSWRKLRNDEIHGLYSSPNIVRVIKSRRKEISGTCGTHGERRGVYRFLVGRPKIKRPLGRPRRRCEDNIKMELTELVIEGAKRIQLDHGGIQWRAFVSTVMNLRVP
jgi:hypothetical protein